MGTAREKLRDTFFPLSVQKDFRQDVQRDKKKIKKHFKNRALFYSYIANLVLIVLPALILLVIYDCFKCKTIQEALNCLKEPKLIMTVVSLLILFLISPFLLIPWLFQRILPRKKYLLFKNNMVINLLITAAAMAIAALVKIIMNSS